MSRQTGTGAPRGDSVAGTASHRDCRTSGPETALYFRLTREEASPDGFVKRLELTRVLVVEDDQDTIDLLRLVLEAEGAEIIAVHTAVEALERIERDSPDIVVSDIAMPDMTGHTLLRLVRALGTPAHRIPAIALSALAMPRERDESIQAGFQVHIDKPFEPETVVRAILELRRGPP
jgi:CheY-like chemotaxis protein